MRATCFDIDMREGFRANARWYLADAALAITLAASFALAARAKGFDASLVPCNFGNLMANALAGMEAFLPSPQEPFAFPASWAVTMLLLAYMTLGYPYRDLTGFGQKVLISSGRRLGWWLSKCAWVFMSVIAFWAVFFGATALTALVLGGNLTLSVSPDIQRVLRWNVLVWFDEGSFAAFLLCVPIGTVAMCMAQLCLSLFIRPSLSYLSTFAGLFLAAFYYQIPLLLGNYLMALRTPGVVGSGFPPLAGLVLSLVIIGTSIVMGAWRFSRMDILEKEQ